MLWEEFLEIFRAKYFPDHVQEQKEREFAELVQGSLSVADYEVRFSALGGMLHIFLMIPTGNSKNSLMILGTTLGDMLLQMILKLSPGL